MTAVVLLVADGARRRQVAAHLRGAGVVVHPAAVPAEAAKALRLAGVVALVADPPHADPTPWRDVAPGVAVVALATEPGGRADVAGLASQLRALRAVPAHGTS